LEPLQIVVLAVLQGIVEFLPISSSGHLILVPSLLGWPDQGLAFDIAVHLGTLTAVVAYFRHDIAALVGAAFDRSAAQFRLAWSLAFASVPVAVAGLLLADLVDGPLRSPGVIAATTGGFGILLWFVDKYGSGERTEQSLGMKRALAIGLGQALAVIPGTSRSGITMTVGLAVGLSREAAARFSFLLAIPAIGMAASWETLQLVSAADPVSWMTMLVAAAISAATAFATIAGFLRIIERAGMWAFALYRVVLAGVIVTVLV
jgi:undecaprenyl-diphosphatase